MKRYEWRALVWAYADTEEEAREQIDSFVAATDASPDVPTLWRDNGPPDVEDEEPSDDQIYNGHGMEGGIGYDTTPDTRDEHDWTL